MSETAQQLNLLRSGNKNYLATRDDKGIMIVPVDNNLKQVGDVVLRGKFEGKG